MAVCTFLGSDKVFEKEEYIYEKILNAVYEIVRENEEVEFLFYNRYYFYKLCFKAVIEVKGHNPERKIKATVVVKQEEKEEFLRNIEENRFGVPDCEIDNVITPPPIPSPKRDADYSAVRKKIERWLIEQSDYLVSYLYPGFHEVENRHYVYARKNKITIYDVTSKETEECIRESMNILRERDQFIVNKINEGLTYREVGELLGISQSAVQQILRRACRELQYAVYKRMRHTNLLFF